MNVVVSALFYYKEELADEFIGVLLPQLAHAAEHAGARVRLVVTLNFPFTAAVWRRIADAAVPDRAKGVDVELIERGFNLGFGRSHNLVFQQHPSDVFVVINNDLFCERGDWLTAMIRKLGPDEEADLVGADESRMALRPSDACGIPAPSPAEADYFEGSLLGFRSATVRRLGLFSEDFRFFYFEDSDLGLRYRQAGAKIEGIPLPHRHLSSGSRQVPRFVVRNIMNANRAAFFAKWSRYLERRRFSGRCYADLGALTFGGCIEALPALIALTRDHPGAAVEIALPDAAPREFFWHPRWQLCAGDFKADPADYDRIWLARTIQPQNALPPVLEHLRHLGSGYSNMEVQTYLRQTSERLPPAGLKPRPGSQLALILAKPPSPTLQGVAPPAEFFRTAAERLRASGYHVVWAVSGAPPPLDPLDTTITIINEGSGLLSAIQQADLVVAPVGSGLTLAQFLGRKTFALCGAILPERAIWAWETTGAYAASQLDCLGCRHVWGEPDRSYCLRRDEACIRTELGGEFARALDDFLAGAKPSLPADALLAAQRAQMTSYRPYFDLDLSRWPED